jgi:hypothetical protein
VPAGNPGTTANVLVDNDNGRGRGPLFRYHDQPALGGIAPANGRPEGGTLVTLSGAGFTVDGPGPNIVFFGGAPASNVSVVSNTTLTCKTPPGAAGSAVDVTLTNLNGSATLPAAFAYRVPPTLTSVSPGRGPLHGGTALTITGTGFVANLAGVDVVTLAAKPALNVVAVSDTLLTCISPAGTAGGPADVVVTNDNGSASAPGAFVYVPGPTLTSIAPTDGSTQGGTQVTLTGAGFSTRARRPGPVRGALATSVSVVSDTTITSHSTLAGCAGGVALNGNGARAHLGVPLPR